jgi:hypothetical protein
MKANKEVASGYGKLKPLTPVLKCGGLHAPLLSIGLDRMEC